MPKQSVDLSSMTDDELHALEQAMKVEFQRRQDTATTSAVKGMKPDQIIDYLDSVSTLDEEYDDRKVEACRATLLKMWPRSRDIINRAVDLVGDLSNDMYELQSMDQDSDEFFDLQEEYEDRRAKLDEMLHSIEY